MRCPIIRPSPAARLSSLPCALCPLLYTQSRQPPIPASTHHQLPEHILVSLYRPAHSSHCLIMLYVHGSKQAAFRSALSSLAASSRGQGGGRPSLPLLGLGCLDVACASAPLHLPCSTLPYPLPASPQAARRGSRGRRPGGGARELRQGLLLLGACARPAAGGLAEGSGGRWRGWVPGGSCSGAGSLVLDRL